MLDNVTKAFGGRPVLDGLSLRVSAGESFGLLGRLGAGKTTVLRILVTLTRPDAGTITVDRLSIDDHPKAVRRQTGYLPEHAGLYRRMTAREYLAFFAGVYGINRPRRVPLADELLDVVNLGERAGDDIDRLSPVDQRRLGLARTLVHDPEVLLFDEPTVGLDDHSRHALHEEMATLVAELADMGKTVMVTGRSLGDVDGICRTVGVIEGGAIVVDGPIDQVGGQVEEALRNRLDHSVAAVTGAAPPAGATGP